MKNTATSNPRQVAELAPRTGSSRLPFRLTINDENGKQHTIGPIWLEIPNKEPWEPVPADFPGGHWEHIARMEIWAKGRILDDVECSLCTESL